MTLPYANPYLHPMILPASWTNVSASNITSLFGGTIYDHIKMLPEHNFFVNGINSKVQFFPVLQDSVKFHFFRQLYIDPPEKRKEFSLSKIHSNVFLELRVWFQLWLDIGMPSLSNNIENSEAGSRIYSFFNSSKHHIIFFKSHLELQLKFLSSVGLIS